MKFTTQTRSAILTSLAEGLTPAEAAEVSDATYRSLQGWLARGRDEDSGEYADFAAAVDAIEIAQARQLEALTPDELRGVVAERCRKGSVAAMRLYWKFILDDRERGGGERSANPLDSLEDELAKARAARR